MASAPPLLSAREAAVVELVARGYASKEIATLLVLSRHTVHTHLRNIFRKCGVCNRAQLVAWWCSRDSPQGAAPDDSGRRGGQTRRNVLGRLSVPRLVAGAMILILAVIAPLPTPNPQPVAGSVVRGEVYAGRTRASNGALPPTNPVTVDCIKAETETRSTGSVCPPSIGP